MGACTGRTSPLHHQLDRASCLQHRARRHRLNLTRAPNCTELSGVSSQLHVKPESSKNDDTGGQRDQEDDIISTKAATRSRGHARVGVRCFLTPDSGAFSPLRSSSVTLNENKTCFFEVSKCSREVFGCRNQETGAITAPPPSLHINAPPLQNTRGGSLLPSFFFSSFLQV